MKKIKANFAQYVAYNLPWKVMYWVLIRLWAYTSTSPEFAHKTSDEITWSDVITSWNNKTSKKK